MQQDARLVPVNLSESSTLQTLVEHRRVFNLKDCELSIYETFHNGRNVVLSHDGLVVSSMMRGKKVMSLDDREEFDFLPGESVILPQGISMKVRFPEADENHPVQCATIALDNDMVSKNLAFLNEHYPGTDRSFEWKLNFHQYHFVNNKDLAFSINKLISISMEDSPEKDALADLSLKFLLMRIIQTQNLASINNFKVDNSNLNPAIQHIHECLTNQIRIDRLARLCNMSKTVFYTQFKEQFGLSPLEYIIRRRIDFAKKIMTDLTLNISDICYQSGFNNVNYFIKIFKRLEGVTPKAFRAEQAYFPSA